MDQLNTITEFLETTGARLRFFDMGRRVTKISREQFLKFEKNETPYPYPLQQQAWFALLFQDKNNQQEPLIWFLRMPLDEQGKLLQAARDDFMHRLIERIGEKMQAEQGGEELEAALQDNPYSFKPNEDRMAVFHARISITMKSPPSKFYEHAQRYFSGELGWDQWSFVGYQGIADIAARQSEQATETMLVTAIAVMPGQPLVALCHCLENETVSVKLTQALLVRTEQELQQDSPDLNLLAATLRGTAQSKSKTVQHKLIHTLLSAPSGKHIEILTALSGRAWEQLQDHALRMQFLERLAENSAGQEAFNLCMADLLFIPGMREPVLSAVRDPNRSAQLSEAIGAMFKGVTGKSDG
ncbi:MAG: DUF3549 family protein [Sedimenticola sp.]|nr:DUF3549 family protein [Sedimenticola sp.]